METELNNNPSYSIDKLVTLIATLRGEKGCPWDKKQTAQSMAVYLLEETYELVEAIGKADADAILEELGDVLFHILFVARLFEEQGAFDITDVVSQIHGKMIRRHPHVFGDVSLRTADEVKSQWKRIKKEEKGPSSDSSILDSVPVTLPGMLRAYRLSERAGETGFDWTDIKGVFAKAEEEWGELKSELVKDAQTGDNRKAVSMEFGDYLFTLVNVARFARIHPETALSEAIFKFKQRFEYMERAIHAAGRELTEVPSDEKERFWEEAKRRVQKAVAPPNGDYT